MSEFLERQPEHIRCQCQECLYGMKEFETLLIGAIVCISAGFIAGAAVVGLGAGFWMVLR